MKKTNNKILIIGKLAPPIGGVTIHVTRLLQDLVRKNFNAFSFYNLSNRPTLEFFLQILRCPVIHIHTSNTYFQLITAIFCTLTTKKLIITYHGNWGRFGYFRNLAASISAWLSFVPLAQNRESLVKMRSWNRNTLLIQAFIRPGPIEPLPDGLLQKLLLFNKRHKYVYCTNATNLTFDKNGAEIYGISELITYFIHEPQAVLIVCDPSGNYKKYIENNRKNMPENVLFVSGNHDFNNILLLSDAFIRNTTTDGDSISIHEALLHGRTVFTTTCVTRPSGCILFNTIKEIKLVEQLEMKKSSGYKLAIGEKSTDTTDKLIKLYRESLE